MNKVLIPFYLLLSLSIFSCNEGNRQGSADMAQPVDTVESEPVQQSLKIAFFYGDSINENYEFLLEANDELDQEEKTIQERLERKMRKAEQRAAELQQQAPTMTQMHMQEAQLELQNLDLEYQRFQEKLMSDFRNREIELRDEYIQRVDSFLDVYNADGKYDFILNYQRGGNLIWAKESYDITEEVVNGLNDAYTAELEKENAKQP